MIEALVVTAVLVAQQGPIINPEVGADEAQLTRLEKTWNDAHLRGDAEILGSLWADDLVITVPKMRVFTKTDALAMVGTGHMRFDRYETTNITVRVHGDSAVTTGRLRRTRNVNGKHFDDDWQFTKAYIRRGGQWKVVAFHASESPQ